MTKIYTHFFFELPDEAIVEFAETKYRRVMEIRIEDFPLASIHYAEKDALKARYIMIEKQDAIVRYEIETILEVLTLTKTLMEVPITSIKDTVQRMWPDAIQVNSEGDLIHDN